MPVSLYNNVATSAVSLLNNLATSAVSLYDNLVWSSGGGANPQLQFFENFPGHLGDAFVAYSQRTISVHAVYIPLSLSFNNVVALLSESNAGSATLQFGLYSLNGSTLSLANSAGASITMANALSWRSFVTSASQNITPGQWYFALNISSGGASSLSFLANSSFNAVNVIPGSFLMGRVTASTAALPASIATSDLDITGSDALRQPYIIITA